MQDVPRYRLIVSYSKYEWGKGQTGGKKCSNTFVPIAFNFFAGFNILQGKLCLSQKLMVF
jgi:hypothetical protein